MNDPYYACEHAIRGLKTGKSMEKHATALNLGGSPYYATESPRWRSGWQRLDDVGSV